MTSCCKALSAGVKLGRHESRPGGGHVAASLAVVGASVAVPRASPVVRRRHRAPRPRSVCTTERSRSVPTNWFMAALSGGEVDHTYRRRPAPARGRERRLPGPEAGSAACPTRRHPGGSDTGVS